MYFKQFKHTFRINKINWIPTYTQYAPYDPMWKVNYANPVIKLKINLSMIRGCCKLFYTMATRFPSNELLDFCPYFIVWYH